MNDQYVNGSRISLHLILVSLGKNLFTHLPPSHLQIGPHWSPNLPGNIKRPFLGGVACLLHSALPSSFQNFLSVGLQIKSSMLALIKDGINHGESSILLHSRRSQYSWESPLQRDRSLINHTPPTSSFGLFNRHP